MNVNCNIRTLFYECNTFGILRIKLAKSRLLNFFFLNELKVGKSYLHWKYARVQPIPKRP